VNTSFKNSLVFLIGLLITHTCGADVLGGEENYYSLCPPEPPLPEISHYGEEKYEIGSTIVTADELEATQDRISIFRGSVELSRGEQGLHADRVTYDRRRDVAEIDGNAEVWDDQIFWSGKHGALDLKKDLTTLKNGDYRLISRRGHGYADAIHVDSKHEKSLLTDVDYSTCDGDRPVWKLSANKLKLDHDEEWGSAQHAVLRVLDFPILYTPYISFPISDKRKTGILPPIIGTTSDSGFQAGIPFYWNIAPEQDATFTPQYYSDRGIMLGGQYRYLLETGGGQADAEYLPSDRLFDDRDRYLFGLRHQQSFAEERGNVNVMFGEASDRQYFEDFGSSLSFTSRRYLERRADVSYADNLGGWVNWHAQVRVQDFQSVDRTLEENVPDTKLQYSRLPQIILTAALPPKDFNLNFQVTGNASYFYFDNADIFVPNKNNPLIGEVMTIGKPVTGGRVEVRPTLSFPMHTASAFLVPRASLSHTWYSLEDQNKFDKLSFQDEITRTLPIFSVDSGLFFERDFNFMDGSFVQTLEPRLFYLYIPDKNQDDIPIFDTGLYDISFPQLFRENRFSSLDRIGDANQVTMAVSSRFIDNETGWEHLRASVGQIYYFDDRDVTLKTDKKPDVFNPQTDVDTDSASELVGEVAARLTREWSARAAMIWDPIESETRKGVLGVRYLSEAGHILNADYRFRQNRDLDPEKPKPDVEQIDVSFRWPFNPSLSVLGRWNYSLEPSNTPGTSDGLKDNTLEVMGGIEYDSCCWSLQLVGRRFLKSSNLNPNIAVPTPENGELEFDTGIFLQLEFKGLAGLGRDTTRYLRKTIPGYGYEDEF
jgi:LPS-assembly protein